MIHRPLVIATSLLVVFPTSARAQEPAKVESEAQPAAEKAAENAEEEYAEADVLELGGSISADWTEDLFRLEGSPSVGYFILDHVELSAIVTISYVNQKDDDTGEREKTHAYAFILEPSYHVPLRDELFLFGGLGLGVGHDGDNFDFEMIPRIGLNIGLTLHGILSPAVSMPIIIDADGTVVGFGSELGYTVAF